MIKAQMLNFKDCPSTSHVFSEWEVVKNFIDDINSKHDPFDMT